jgi:hypothetical protein
MHALLLSRDHEDPVLHPDDVHLVTVEPGEALGGDDLVGA